MHFNPDNNEHLDVRAIEMTAEAEWKRFNQKAFGDPRGNFICPVLKKEYRKVFYSGFCAALVLVSHLYLISQDEDLASQKVNEVIQEIDEFFEEHSFIGREN